MALAATLLTFAVQPFVAPTPPVCHTVACQRRVARRWTRRRWRTVTRPYRPWLERVGGCETRGQRHPYRTNTGNGFFGRYQFTLRSWRYVGGDGLPHRAEPLEQDYRAVRLLRVQGRGAWPVCG
jgi:hypothetical protein